MDNDSVLIHFHIGRTGGVSFRNQILNRKFGTSLMPITVNKTHSTPIDKIGFKYIGDYCNLSNSHKNKINCLSGHLPFGIHKYIPKPSKYISLIRNPIDRLISEWNSVSTRVNHPFHKYVLSKNKLTFEDYISLDIFDADFNIPDNIFMGAGVKNHQTRFYSGFLYNKALPGNKPNLNDSLKFAKQNIEKHFLLIGMVEKYDEYLLLLKKLLKWHYKDICYPHMKLNKSKYQKVEISKKTISLIEKNNINDMELYEFVCKRFDKKINQFDSFQDDLKYFRKLNRIYGDVYIKYFYNFYKRVHEKINLFVN